MMPSRIMAIQLTLDQRIEVRFLGGQCSKILSQGRASVARLAHNQEVVGSIPTPAISENKTLDKSNVRCYT